MTLEVTQDYLSRFKPVGVWIPFGMFKQKITAETFASPATTRRGLGQSARSFNYDVTSNASMLDSGFYAENGKRSMSDIKSIVLNQGGRWDFKVTKMVTDDIDRFTVTLGNLDYGRGIEIAGMATWAEASAAMNKFRAEFDDAFEALVQISTLTPSGAHEES